MPCRQTVVLHLPITVCHGTAATNQLVPGTPAAVTCLTAQSTQACRACTLLCLTSACYEILFWFGWEGTFCAGCVVCDARAHAREHSLLPGACTVCAFDKARHAQRESDSDKGCASPGGRCRGGRGSCAALLHQASSMPSKDLQAKYRQTALLTCVESFILFRKLLVIRNKA